MLSARPCSRPTTRLRVLLLATLVACFVAAFVALSTGAALATTPRTAPAQAAPSSTSTWSVRPTPTDAAPARPNFTFDVEGGATVDDSVRVRNFGTEPLTLSIYASDALTTKTGALDLLPANKEPKDVGAWIQLATDSITVAPGAFVDVPFSMNVPANAASGDHTGGIVTSLTTPATGTGNTPVLLDRRLGTRVQVRVGGPLRPLLEITDVKTEYEGTINPVGKGTVHVTYTVRNTGNVRVTAVPTITVEGPLGLVSTTLRTAAMPELLPANSLTFAADVEAFPAVKLDTTVELQPRATQDRRDLPATACSTSASTSVWAVPWVLIVVIVVIVAVLVLWRWSRRRQQRQVDTKVQEAVAAALGKQLEPTLTWSADEDGATPDET